MEKTAPRGFFYFLESVYMEKINALNLKSPFELIGSDWMLITAEKEGKVNTMTASWGGMGVLWNKNVVFVFIRESRYTKEFVDSSDKFSLSFFGDGFKDKLTYLGRVSGRDENKIEKTGLEVLYADGVPYFSQAETVIVCNKLYAQDLSENGFISRELFEKMYPGGDIHTVYVAEIENVYKNS